MTILQTIVYFAHHCWQSLAKLSLNLTQRLNVTHQRL